MMRLNNGGLYSVANLPKYLRASGGVTGALTDATYNIGTIDEANQTILRIINGSTPSGVKEHYLSDKNTGISLAASQISSRNTFIEFTLPENHINKNVSLEIYDLTGKLVTKFVQKVFGVNNHVSWNGTDSTGKLAGKGTYIVRLVSEGISISSKFLIAR